MTIASSEDVKSLVLDMIKEMTLDIEDFHIEEKDLYLFGSYAKGDSDVDLILFLNYASWGA